MGLTCSSLHVSFFLRDNSRNSEFLVVTRKIPVWDVHGGEDVLCDTEGGKKGRKQQQSKVVDLELAELTQVLKHRVQVHVL